MKSTPGVARPTDHPTFARASVTFASIIARRRRRVLPRARVPSRRRRDLLRSTRSLPSSSPTVHRARSRPRVDVRSHRIALSRTRSATVPPIARRRPSRSRTRPRPRARDGARVVARAVGVAHRSSRGDRRSARGASRSRASRRARADATEHRDARETTRERRASARERERERRARERRAFARANRDGARTRRDARERDATRDGWVWTLDV